MEEDKEPWNRNQWQCVSKSRLKNINLSCYDKASPTVNTTNYPKCCIYMHSVRGVIHEAMAAKWCAGKAGIMKIKKCEFVCSLRPGTALLGRTIGDVGGYNLAWYWLRNNLGITKMELLSCFLSDFFPTWRLQKMFCLFVLSSNKSNWNYLNIFPRKPVKYRSHCRAVPLYYEILLYYCPADVYFDNQSVSL